MLLLKKIHVKMVSTFGKNYSLCFLSIYMGLMFAILSLDYKNSTMRKIELVISLFCILFGIFGLIYSYKVAKENK